MHLFLLFALLSLPFGRGFIIPGRTQHQRPKMHMSYEESSPVKLSSVIILTVGIVGVFGISSVSFLKDLPATITQSEKVQLKNDSPERGSMTRLTKREINNKLNQVPVFYVRSSSNGVYTDSANMGYFFMEKEDCDKYVDSNKLNRNDVKATTLGTH